MYVYVKGGKIRLRSMEKIKAPGFQEYKTDHKMTDRLIFEDAKIKIYENSRQYIEDTDRYHLEKELIKQQKRNKDLETIAKAKMQKDLELDAKGEEASDYHKNIYLLKSKR